MSDSINPLPEDYIKALENTNSITEPAIRAAIRELQLHDGCHVLDVPCGIGSHTLWMAEENPNINIAGVDFSEDNIVYARRLLLQRGNPASVIFEKGDINKLDFDDNSFDLVWCCDGIWPGPKETGCPAEEPYGILKDMARITKSGGKIAVLFWSGQKLLPGYPLIEAGLNNTRAASFPVPAEPDLHFMRTPLWLRKAGLKNIHSKTFAVDVKGPLSPKQKDTLLLYFNMFWGQAKTEVPDELWTRFKSVADIRAVDCILNREDYAGFITYTMFTGEV